jgi:hypothetical protein
VAAAAADWLAGFLPHTMTHLSRKLAGACALVLTALTASAQVFVGSDDFNSGFISANWDYGYRNHGATSGNLSFNFNRMDFSIPPGTGGNFNRLWNSDGTSQPNVAAVSYTTDWVMNIQATNTLTGVSGADFGAIGFQVFNDQGSYSALMLNVNSLGLAVRAEGNGFSTAETLVGDGTDVSLRLTWNATARTLGAAYSFDGSSFTSIATFLPTSQWDNSDPAYSVDNGFNFGVFGNTNITTGIGVGSMYVDNFSLTAVPEPSTYAALSGLAALGLAGWHRRRKVA